jgi:hypothetical protein
MSCFGRAMLVLSALAATSACGGAGTGATTAASECRTGGTGDTTLVELRDGADVEVPATREVVAWYRGTADCGTCPPEALCQPCVTMLLFSDTPDAVDADVFWLFNLASEGAFREGCAYVLELSLDEGYRQDLAVHDNNPLYFADNGPAVEIVEVH